MAIHWNVSKCEKSEILINKKGSKKPKDIQEWTITEALIWAGFQIGLPQITKKNIDEYYKRVNILEKISGTFIRGYNKKTKDWEDMFLTKKDIINRIGMTTNHSTMTDAKFWKLLRRNINREY